MKIKISENKLDSIIFQFLDNKNYIIEEILDNYYFLENYDDKFAKIKIAKDDGICYVNVKLLSELGSFFGVGFEYGGEVIGKYVENSLNIKVTEVKSAWLRLRLY